MRFPALAALPFLLSACGLPSAVVMTAYTIEGGSYMATGKTASDHALSEATKKDCTILYGLTRGQFCEEKVAHPADTKTSEVQASPTRPVTEPVMLAEPATTKIDDVFLDLEAVQTSANPKYGEAIKSAKPRPSTPPSSPQWTLVLGTFDNEAAARTLLKRMKPVKGLITVSVIDGKVAYRVSTLPFRISQSDTRKEQVAHLELTDIHVFRVCPGWMRDDRCIVLDRALSRRQSATK